jgi:hypothetical protein
MIYLRTVTHIHHTIVAPRLRSSKLPQRPLKSATNRRNTGRCSPLRLKRLLACLGPMGSVAGPSWIKTQPKREDTLINKQSSSRRTSFEKEFAGSSAHVLVPSGKSCVAAYLVTGIYSGKGRGPYNNSLHSSPRAQYYASHMRLQWTLKYLAPLIT